MIRSRFGLLGLCIALLGAMAFCASAVQAEVGAQWLFAEKEGTKSVPFLEASLGFEAETVFILHIEIEGKKILIECKSISTENAVLKASGSIGKGAKIKFGGCIVKLNGVTQPECEPNVGKADQGVISTNALHALLQLRELASKEKITLLAFSPDEKNEVWATYQTSTKCAIGPELTIFGSLELKECVLMLSVPLIKHLFEPGPFFGGLWVLKHTAEHSLTILGSWWAFLTGTHEGLKWSGDPA